MGRNSHHGWRHSNYAASKSCPCLDRPLVRAEAHAHVLTKRRGPSHPLADARWWSKQASLTLASDLSVRGERHQGPKLAFPLRFYTDSLHIKPDILLERAKLRGVFPTCNAIYFMSYSAEFEHRPAKKILLQRFFQTLFELLLKVATFFGRRCKLWNRIRCFHCWTSIKEREMGSYSYTASVKVVKNMRKEMWSLISIGKFTQFLREPITIPPLLESALGVAAQA